MKKINFAALLVIAGMGWTAQSAHALTYTSGDLLIGFRSTSGSITQDYVIDIGNVSLYSQMNGATFTLSVGDTLGNLQSIFGSTPFSANTTKWGIAGDLGSTLYAGKNETTFGTFPVSTATGNYKRDQAGNQLQTASNIDTAGGYFATLSAAPNTTVGAFQPTGNGASWATSMSGAAFGLWSNTAFEPTINGANNNGHGLDLFRIAADDANPGSDPTYLGRFVIDTSTGNISFTAAVPEPSTLTALAGGAALLGLVRRRRAVAA